MDDNQKLAALLTGGFFLVFTLVALAIAVTVWGLLFKKAGYSFWLGLVMLIPVGNLILLIWFLAAKWPIQAELERLRALQPGQAGVISASAGS